MKEGESKKEVAGQFGIYTIFAILTTVINVGGQFILRPFIHIYIAIAISLAIGYTLKFFLDCYITFKKEKTEDTDVRLQFIVYLAVAFGFYIINLLLQIAFYGVGIALFTSSIWVFTIEDLAWLFSVGVSLIIVFGIKFFVDKYFIFRLIGQKNK